MTEFKTPGRAPRARWRQLSATEWRLLVMASLLQVAIAAALRVLTLRACRSVAARVRSPAQLLFRASPERTVWAIEAAGRRLGPLSTCLVRALAAELAIAAADSPTMLTIGVRRAPTGAFEAHAWLTRSEQVIIGATRDQFLPLVSWRMPDA